MKSRKCSIYEIAFDYIEMFYNEELPAKHKRHIIMAIGNLLSDGWTADEIYENMIGFKYKHANTILDIESYFKTIKPKRFNMLDPTRFYFHNQLRITTPPPMIDFDYNTGALTRVVSDHFLEMRASYTIDDLYHYFLEKQCLYEKDVLTTNRMLGSLKWLANQFDIDLLLFMLDVANDIILTSNYQRLRNPMDINEYYAEANELYQRKITECKIAGDDKIVPQKRVLFGRSRLLA